MDEIDEAVIPRKNQQENQKKTKKDNLRRIDTVDQMIMDINNPNINSNNDSGIMEDGQVRSR